MSNRTRNFSHLTTTLGERLEDFYINEGLSRREFANIIGVEYDRLSKWVVNKSEPPNSIWQVIQSKFPDADITELITGISGLTGYDPMSNTIPVVSTAHAGHITVGFADEDVIEWLPFMNTKDKGVFAVKVAGDSMSPEINEGDYAICSPNKPFVSGKIYLIVTENSEHTIKRVYRQVNAFLLVATNPEYPPVILEDKEVIKLIRIIYHYGKHE